MTDFLFKEHEMTGMFIALEPGEKDALRILAKQEFREARKQAALIIHQELERRGLLIDKAHFNQDGSQIIIKKGEQGAV
jgi:hypothetical protein